MKTSSEMIRVRRQIRRRIREVVAERRSARLYAADGAGVAGPEPAESRVEFGEESLIGG